ncbi:MAG: hypothetical protein ACJ741_13070 [Pyrinomonadaceae bacterium]
MTTPRAQWMADPVIQSKKVGQLVLPGTHDSGTYSLTLELSQVEYSNISFLWKLKDGQAPKGFPGKSPYYLGPDLYNFVFLLVRETAQAHDQPLYQQLTDGIRYFDLRLYWDTDIQELYIHHGLRGAAVSDLLQDVGKFVADEGGRELIFLEVSHTNFSEQPDGPPTLLARLKQYLGAKLYVPENLDALAATKLSDITGQGSRVVVLNTDDYQYPQGSPVLNTTGFQDSGRGADGVDDVTQLEQAEAQGLAQARTSPFYKINWTLTPQMADIINGAVARVTGTQSAPMLKGLADKANAALQAFVSANGQYPFNLINVDWYEDSPVVDIAVELSMS